MLDSIFLGIFDTGTTITISITDFLLCIGVSLLLGLVMAGAYTFKNRCTKSFIMTLALLPCVVCIVIMMVNGNIGAGVAVAGAFSLVRFRSAPGTAREIVALFLGMGAGLIAGMGYLGFATLFTLIMCAALMLYSSVNFKFDKTPSTEKTLKITIPEDLDYTEVFDDLFKEYATDATLIQAKTINMGSMFRLKYNLTLRDAACEKEFIDKLRCRNGNLEISIFQRENESGEL